MSVYDVNVPIGTLKKQIEKLPPRQVQIPGPSAYEDALAEGFYGSRRDWLKSLRGPEGKSAYEVAVDNGYEGTEEEWIDFVSHVESEAQRQANETQRVEAEIKREALFEEWKAVIDHDQIKANQENISRNDKRITNLEQGLPDDNFMVDETVAYTKDVPTNALPYAEIQKVGGMTYKDGDALRSAKVTEVKSVGANMFGGDALKDKFKAEMTNATVNATDKTIGYYASYADGKTFFTDFKPNTQYTFIFKGIGTSKFLNINIVYTDDTYADYWRFNGSDVSTFSFVSDPSKSIKSLVGVYYDGHTTLYYDECGIFEGVLTADDFKPYVKRTFPIPAAVRPANGINENVYDYIEWVDGGRVKKTVKCGVVDMGAQSYAADIPNNYAYITALAKKDFSPVLCSHYPEHITNIMTNKFGDIIVYFEAGAFTSVEQVKAAMSGVMLVYELATPEVTDISDLITADNLIGVEGNGSLTFVNEYGYAVPSTVEYQLEV